LNPKFASLPCPLLSQEARSTEAAAAAAAPTGFLWLVFVMAVFIAVYPTLTLFNAVCRLVTNLRYRAPP